MQTKRLFSTVCLGIGLSVGLGAGPGLPPRPAWATDLYGGGSDLTPDVRNMLLASDPERRRKGVEVLEGLPGRLAVPHLMQRLRDEDPLVRARAARALGPMAGPLLDAAPLLIDGLSDIDGSVRAACAEALGQMGALPRELLGRATAALGRAMGDAQFEVRIEVVRATARLLRAQALSDVGGTSEQATLLGPLLLRVEDENVGVRRVAVTALGRTEKLATTKEVGARVVVALLGRLSDPARDVRAEALVSLAALGPSSAGVEMAALRLLRDPTDEVRKQAVLCLGRIGVVSAVPTLIEMLDLDLATVPGGLIQRARTPDALRVAAAQGLGAFIRSATATATAPTGQGAAKPAGDEAARSKATDAALSALLQALDRDELRPAAREALLDVGPAALGRLVQQLLARLGTTQRPLSQPELGAIVDLLRDLVAATGTNGPMAPASRLAIADALRAELLRGRLPREQLIDALGALGTAGEPSIAPLLAGLLSDRDAVVRRRALQALDQAGAQRPLLDGRALDALVTATRDRELRAPAARALGGVRSRAAIPRLVELLQDADAEVRAAAASALGRIGATAAPLDGAALGALLSAVTTFKEGPAEQKVRRAASQAIGQAVDAAPSLAAQAMPPLLAVARSRIKGNSTGGDGGRAEVLAALGAVLRGRPSETARDVLLDLAQAAPEPHSPEAALGLDALDALAASRDASILAKLTRLLEHDAGAQRDPLKRVRVASAIGTVLGAPGAVSNSAADGAISALLRVLSEDGDARVAAEAAWALGLLPRGASAQVKRAGTGLRQALQRTTPVSTDPALRTNVLGALVLLGQPDPGDAEWLGDGDPGVRANAALLVGMLRSPGAPGSSPETAQPSPGMRARLKHVALVDDDYRVRQSAERALAGKLPGVSAAGAADQQHFLGMYQTDYDHRPLAETRFRLTRPDGIVRVGVTDSRGIAREERLPPGTCDIELLEEGLLVR